MFHLSARMPGAIEAELDLVDYQTKRIRIEYHPNQTGDDQEKDNIEEGFQLIAP